MDYFKIIIKSIFKHIGRTISLTLLYISSFLMVFFSVNLGFNVGYYAKTDLGVFFLSLITLILMMIGLIVFIDTVIFQVKSWDINR